MSDYTTRPRRTEIVEDGEDAPRAAFGYGRPPGRVPRDEPEPPGARGPNTSRSSGPSPEIDGSGRDISQHGPQIEVRPGGSAGLGTLGERVARLEHRLAGLQNENAGLRDRLEAVEDRLIEAGIAERRA